MTRGREKSDGSTISSTQLNLLNLSLFLTALLGSRILPFTKADAEFAGQLFQAPGVKRAQRLDTMIAATAILEGAELATVNVSDFAPFIPFGLKLLGAPKH